MKHCRPLRIGRLVIAALPLAGCASLITRDMLPRDETPTPYIGAARDAELAFTSPSNWTWVTPLALIDLPFSLVFDTVALPWSRQREPVADVDPPDEQATPSSK